MISMHWWNMWHRRKGSEGFALVCLQSHHHHMTKPWQPFCRSWSSYICNLLLKVSSIYLTKISAQQSWPSSCAGILTRYTIRKIPSTRVKKAVWAISWYHFMNRIRSAGLPWSTVLSSLGVLLAAVLLIAPTLLWYALARTSFVQWGIISTSTINTMQLVLILLLAKDNPLWLPVAIVGHVQISRILEPPWYRESAHHWELRDQVWKE